MITEQDNKNLIKLLKHIIYVLTTLKSITYNPIALTPNLCVRVSPVNSNILISDGTPDHVGETLIRIGSIVPLEFFRINIHNSVKMIKHKLNWDINLAKTKWGSSAMLQCPVEDDAYFNIAIDSDILLPLETVKILEEVMIVLEDSNFNSISFNTVGPSVPDYFNFR